MGLGSRDVVIVVGFQRWKVIGGELVESKAYRLFAVLGRWRGAVLRCKVTAE
jgi:hypothetical protein